MTGDTHFNKVDRESIPAVNTSNCCFVILEVFTPGASSYDKEGGRDLPFFFGLYLSHNFLSCEQGHWKGKEEDSAHSTTGDQVTLATLQGRGRGMHT